MAKILLLSLIFILAFVKVNQSQSIAEDWTSTDCGGTTHNLFTYLDAEDVVILEFGMGCSTCAMAGDYLVAIRDHWEITHPGKVKVFYMDYWTGNTCAGNVIPMTDTIAFDGGFDHCLSQKTYYMSATVMPGIVILGGSNHLVLSEKNSFSPGDTTNINTTITNFFNTVGINKIKEEESSILLFPNPSNGQTKLQVNWNKNEPVNICIYDLTGNEIMQLSYSLIAGKQEINLPMTHLNEGNYILKVQSPLQTISLPVLIKL